MSQRSISFSPKLLHLPHFHFLRSPRFLQILTLSNGYCSRFPRVPRSSALPSSAFASIASSPVCFLSGRRGSMVAGVLRFEDPAESRLSSVAAAGRSSRVGRRVGGEEMKESRKSCFVIFLGFEVGVIFNRKDPFGSGTVVFSLSRVCLFTPRYSCCVSVYTEVRTRTHLSTSTCPPVPADAFCVASARKAKFIVALHWATCHTPLVALSNHWWQASLQCQSAYLQDDKFLLTKASRVSFFTLAFTNKWDFLSLQFGF
ncbi:hypothetical protein CK203_052527 [Vitis vinifera]|uniref:Uncharacterized protein n=1 Tax=Vitis vinifera TaxID=29760 RepID=A0A438GIG3_VITVI|nr:hypothetical protein CK203_052527 [Vitis vinifera]